MVRGLSKFVNENYHKWGVVDWKWKNVVVDGHNVCCTIYNNNLSCKFGGEYDQFKQDIEEFFKEIQWQDCKPIVIFYGGKDDESRLPIVRERRLQSFRNMKKGNIRYVKLHMIKYISMDVLRRLEIEFYVASGEPHKAIAALANKKGCPVLSSGSDYFIFDLNHGFIHFNRYLEQKKSLFIRDQFMEQFSLKNDQCLIIPAEFRTKEFDRFVFERLIRSYKTFGEYCVKKAVPANIYEDIKRSYCDLQVPTGVSDGSGSIDKRFATLPGQVFERFTTGCFPPFLIIIRDAKYYLLPTMVEVINFDSAWLISREIRQYLYGFLGHATVVENIRENYISKLIEEPVHPKFLQPALSIDNFPFSDLDENKRQLIVLVPLEMLSSEDFKQLDAKWKLPIAATSYWYRHLDVPMPFIKSLVLSFLTCSDVIPPPGMVPRPDTIDPRSNSKYQQALHTFAKWQCVYHDATALNYVACEPFPTTSIASLYSGQVAMSYALGYRSVDGVIDAGSDEGKLYKRFLDLVTVESEVRQIETSSDGQGDIQQSDHLGSVPQQGHRKLLSC